MHVLLKKGGLPIYLYEICTMQGVKRKGQIKQPCDNVNPFKRLSGTPLLCGLEISLLAK